MKADSTDKAGIDSPTGREGTEVGDPFAVDLFARGRRGAGASAHVVATDALADPIVNTDAPATLRQLSRTELAAVEFLWLCLIRDLHRQVDAPLWRLDSVSSAPPASLKGRRGGQEETRATGDDTAEETNPRAVVATFALRVGALNGLVSFYFTRDALTAFEGLRHSPFFAGRGRDSRRELFKFFAPDVRLRPVLGETDVRAIDLADLETGDVVVVARPLARFEAGRLSGRLEMCLGDGVGTILTGTLTTDNDAAQFLIEQIKRGGELHGTERWDMEQEQTSDEDSNESAIALEEILLTVRVELAERRLSLDELARLRVGQLLPLGCEATDPVDLLADGRRVARGELVEIEGRLGVRVTEVLR